MELDLPQVRAFVEVAEQLHFGRAAARLFLTQQALSKRIQRLEHTLGEPLLVRGTRGVELSDAGHRFLPHARQLLAALEALGRAEIDACFGRVQDLDRPWPSGLTHRPVLLERLAVAVSAKHRLADATLLRPADLRESVMWFPAGGSPVELLGGYRRFADHFRIPLDSSGHNLGLEHAIEQLYCDRRRFTRFGRDWPIPRDAGIRLIELDPTPCCLWSLVWRQEDRHPVLGLLLQRAVETGRTEGWLAYDPQRDWLPDIDLAGLRRYQ